MAVQIVPPREVTLGGATQLAVRRTLPSRDRSFVGAWCFADHYGPVPARTAMDVPPHPHTGLQTVSWLFAGEIEHRDSGGVHALIRPGEVNLMTGGHGIAHSEVSTPASEVLHGVQLWVALPDDARDAPRAFDHHVPAAVPLPGAAGTVRVFVGTLPGLDASPVRVYTPLLGAQLDLAAGASVALAVDPAFEHGLLVDAGAPTLDGAPLASGDLGVVDAGPAELTIEAGAEPVRAVLLGGTPFDAGIVMWWNLIARSHDEIAEWRDEWQGHGERFGEVAGYAGAQARIPAPPLPALRLLPRYRRGR